MTFPTVHDLLLLSTLAEFWAWLHVNHERANWTDVETDAIPLLDQFLSEKMQKDFQETLAAAKAAVEERKKSS